MFLISFCSCLCPIHWSQVLSREWRCSWSSTVRRCSNYIWVINNFVACYGMAYIRGLTVLMACFQWSSKLNYHDVAEPSQIFHHCEMCLNMMMSWHVTTFCITGPCGFSSQMPSNTEFWCLICCWPEQTGVGSDLGYHDTHGTSL